MTRTIYLLAIPLLFSVLLGCEVPSNTPDQVQPPAASAFEAAPITGRTIVEEAPLFTAPTLTGGTLDFADYQGKTVLVNFWATWCGPCIAEIPDLIALQDELGPEHFSVIGLSMDIEPYDVIQEFVDKMEVNYPIAVDEGPIAEAFGGVLSLPTTFVIDKHGKIQKRTIGIFPAEAFKPHLISMIEQE